MKRPITTTVFAGMLLFLVFLYRNGSLSAVFAKVFPIEPRGAPTAIPPTPPYVTPPYNRGPISPVPGTGDAPYNPTTTLARSTENGLPL